MRLRSTTIKVSLAGVGMAIVLMGAPASAQALYPYGSDQVIGNQVDNTGAGGNAANDSSAQRVLGQISDPTDVAAESRGLALTGTDVVGMIGLALALTGAGVLILRGRDFRRSEA